MSVQQTEEVAVRNEFASRIKEVHEYSGVTTYGNPYAQVGELVDIWADLIEGFGEQAPDFFQKFHTIMMQRKIGGSKAYWGNLSTTAFQAPQRGMQYYFRSPVTITVFVARQGSDLYVSWRAFVQSEVSVVKIIVLLGLAMVMSIAFSNHIFGVSVSQFYTYFRGFIFSTVALFSLVAIYGFFRRRGDHLGLLRNSLHELHYDDVISFSEAVHRSIIVAADQVGIDTAKLQPREFTMRDHRPRRRI